MSTRLKPGKSGVAGRVAEIFIHSKLTPLIVLTSILLGLGAILLLPREEEPQIKVPMIDVLVAMPGFSAREVEQRATGPMEKLLWEIPGVEYIYSISRPGQALAIVRFKVGEDVERSLVKLNQKLQANFDRIPQGVRLPLVKPRSIDDVPILALTFHTSSHDHLALRRVAAEVEDAIKQVPQVAETMLIGGARRQVQVLLDPARLASRHLAIIEVAEMIRRANQQAQPGTLTSDNREVLVETGEFLRDATDVAAVVVGVHAGKPVYLRDVAEVLDTTEEPAQYVLFGRGAAVADPGEVEPAVTLSIAKRPGANAITVADQVLKKLEHLKGRVLPADIQIAITRHYGKTAAEKSNELLLHMGIAIAGVSLLILLVLGWRESLIVGVAIPATLALTLLVFYLAGFTLNRITLFALIFSIGILVDDAIVVIENIVRHFHLPGQQGRSRADIATAAVNEVGNPTILATFAVIAAVLPMAFVGGLMGPYMRPIPIGASAAMAFSLLIAFIVTPWAALRVLAWRNGHSRLLARSNGHTPEAADTLRSEDALTRTYRRIMAPLLSKPIWRFGFLGAMLILLLGSMALVGISWVQVKMLPFDNKSEFQVILNMPEGTSLEQTTKVAQEIGAAVRHEPEVTDYQIYAGVAAPFNFNGLVRHYFMRGGPNMADLQINLLNKHQRKAQSHAIAKRIRPAIAAIAARHGGRVAIAEVPPGPPVLQTLVAEVYGPDEPTRLGLARQIIDALKNTPGVVDIDWYIDTPAPKAIIDIDREKAALHRIDSTLITRTLDLAIHGEKLDLLHLPREIEDLDILARLPRTARARPEDLLNVYLPSPTAGGAPVPLREFVSIRHATNEQTIYHKNLMPVTYVVGDVAGHAESPVYAIQSLNKKLRELDLRPYGTDARLRILNAAQPFTDHLPVVKWDGEWHITLEVFRDLGLAFAAVLVLIYVLMVGWFRSFLTPIVVMAAIPFSLVGILPAHGALGAFFTATSMIGFMAGAGIVVRNSIILVDFIEQRLGEGMPLAEAVVDAGAVRFRPMLLTAMAVVVGAGVILFDPIFQGLAISLMGGEIASLLISRMAVPVLYFMAARLRLTPARFPD